MHGGGDAERDRIRLSVIIPCRNAAATIGEQLDALARQSFRGAWEVVIVDDGSSDATRDVVESFRERFPLVVIDAGAGHHSPARARNVGAKAAHGGVLLFCDADDVVDDGWGAALQDALDHHDLVCARRDLRRLNGRLEIDSARDVPAGPILWWDGQFLPSTAGCVLGVRRSVHEVVGGFDETFVRLGEDVDYCWRVQQTTGGAIYAVPDAIVHYRLRTGHVANFRQARNYGASNVYVYVKWKESLSVPPHQWSAGLWAWVRVLADLRRVRGRDGFGRWVWEVGNLVGYAEASVRLRVLVLCPSAGLARRPRFRFGRPRPDL
jgi:glycosyltransferase involved in cell wall biosynthesis